MKGDNVDMKEKRSFLSKGLFEKSFMDSKIKTRSVSKKEKILGHLIGPLGLIFVVNTIAALVEKFFTQQTGLMYGEGNLEMIVKMGETYGIVMTIAKILAIGLGLLNGFLMQRTKSRQGRMRPWYLIFGFISIVIGALMFLFPGTALGESYWFYFFILLACYHTLGSTYFYLFRDNICSITTHNSKEKMQVQFIRKMSWTLISGILIGMIVSSVILPHWLEKDINGYAILMVILSIVAVPLLLMEYFYTKERVIEDVKEISGADKTNKIPLKDQMKALASNKVFILMTIAMTVGLIVDNFKGGNVQYFYIKFMLGGAENPSMYMLYQIITGVPLGLGAVLAYPLAKKFGIKNIAIVGFSAVLLGSVLGWIFPSNLPIAMVSGFIRQMGMIPNAYVLVTLLIYSYDSIEHKSGFRLEGLLGVSIIIALQAAICAPFAGGYESAILQLGFVDAEGVIPGQGVTDFMTMSFYLFDIILAVVFLACLPFINIEKQLPQINADLLERRKAAVIARGEQWIEPEEQDRLQREKDEKEYEENRILDLKDRCEKKGLDFDTENNKYLAAKAEKERKWNEKQAEKKRKADEKAAKKIKSNDDNEKVE